MVNKVLVVGLTCSASAITMLCLEIKARSAELLALLKISRDSEGSELSPLSVPTSLLYHYHKHDSIYTLTSDPTYRLVSVKSVFDRSGSPGRIYGFTCGKRSIVSSLKPR